MLTDVELAFWDPPWQEDILLLSSCYPLDILWVSSWIRVKLSMHPDTFDAKNVIFAVFFLFIAGVQRSISFLILMKLLKTQEKI